MNIIPTPASPKLPAAESQPGAGGTSLTKGGAADQATQASFPAAFAQANQQASASKTLPNGKDQSENPTVQSLTTNEDEGVSIPHGEGIEESLVPMLAPLNLQPVGVEDVPLPADNTVTLASALNVQTHSTAVISSPLVVSPVISSLVERETGSGNTNPNPNVSPSTSLPSVKGVNPGENLPQALPNSSLPSASAPSQNRPEVFVGTSSKHEAPPLILPREQSLPLPSGNRVPLPNVPLSFVNGGFQQGQVVIDPVNTPQLSPTIPQHIQGPFTSGISTATIQDAIANSQVSGAGLGEGETSGDEFGSGGQQENAGAFANKQQASGHSFGSFSIATELGSDIRVGESALSGRADAMVDRSRMINVFSPQRLQMEVRLSEDTKVQVDVAVTQQQVSAQLMTDQLMLRNLALQHEPQLDAQLASAGLELKQFGAEVSEHGLFGQHLSDSSSQESSGRGGREAQELPDSEILVGAGAEADGRFHFVA